MFRAIKLKKRTSFFFLRDDRTMRRVFLPGSIFLLIEEQELLGDSYEKTVKAVIDPEGRLGFIAILDYDSLE